jgi:quercetin dioxygenase-like cupin family protein
VVTPLPFTQTNLESNKFLREFDPHIDSQELVWHRDQMTRLVLVLEGQGWQFQIDNCLPERLVPGEQFVIPAKTWHRLIKGLDKLIVSIQEY